jgi:HK97 family phage major capsid protein
MTEIKLDEVHVALKELREEMDKKSPDLSKVEKLEEICDAHEAKSQELVKNMTEEKAAREELEAKFKELEADASRPNLAAESKNEALEELKAFENYVVKGDLEEKYLRTDVNSDGGYLVPIQQESEIIKKITEISPIRQVAKVRTMGSKTMRMPVRSALVSGSWVGEGVEDSLSASTYGREELVAKSLQVTVQITRHELQDATPNMVAEINSDVAEAFAQLEGTAFVNGNGVEKPSGFMTDSRVSEINSGSASTISFDNFAELEGQLKTGYSAIYGFNRSTLATVRNLKDGAGAYIWRAGNLGAGIPNSINGTSYIEIPDMADIGAGNYPIIFGDFAKGYLIGDRLGFNVIRDDVTKKRESKVEFTYLKRLDGQVILPEAFVKLKVSA